MASIVAVGVLLKNVSDKRFDWKRSRYTSIAPQNTRVYFVMHRIGAQPHPLDQII